MPSCWPKPSASRPSGNWARTSSSRGCRAGRGGDRRLEGLLAEVHHGEVDTLDNLAFGGQAWQHVLCEKVCHGDLSGVIRAVALGKLAVECVERDLGLVEQQPADQQVADRAEEPNRLQPKPTQFAGG